MGAYTQIAVLIYAVMRRTPVAGIWEYIVSLLYLPVFTIWVSVTKQASHTLELSIAWVSATKQASHTLELSIAWVSAAKQASHTLKLFSVRVSAAKQASHTLELSIAWVSATKQASHTHKLFTLRQKKGHRQALVEFTAALRYEPCTQFINVSQKTLHIY